MVLFPKALFLVTNFRKNKKNFVARKIHLLKKNFGKLRIFYKNFWIFRQIILKSSIFKIPFKSREFPGDFYYLIEKLIKKLKI